MAGLLGNKPSRNFKIFRTDHPAIFRFNGRLYMEFFDIDVNQHVWTEIGESEAMRWLKAKESS